MKNLIALFSKTKKQSTIADFANDVLNVNDLFKVRGGGEYAPIEETLIIIPPDQL